MLSALLGAGSAWASNLGKADQKLLSDLAMANMAEIETARLALHKTRSDRVRIFAQQMLDDHAKGLEEVRKVAAARNGGKQAVDEAGQRDPGTTGGNKPDSGVRLSNDKR